MISSFQGAQTTLLKIISSGRSVFWVVHFEAWFAWTTAALQITKGNVFWCMSLGFRTSLSERNASRSAVIGRVPVESETCAQFFDFGT